MSVLSSFFLSNPDDGEGDYLLNGRQLFHIDRADIGQKFYVQHLLLDQHPYNCITFEVSCAVSGCIILVKKLIYSKNI
jgi:hypothetical protein